MAYSVIFAWCVMMLGCIGIICTPAYALDTQILELAVTQEEGAL